MSEKQTEDLNEDLNENLDEAWMRAGVAAELSRHFRSDAREFFHLLVLLLEGALPEATHVERRGSLLGKKRPVRLTVEIEDFQYSLEDTPRSLLATRRHVVRGIALKTEEMPVPQWIAELGAALDRQAQINAQAHEALSKWLA